MFCSRMTHTTGAKESLEVMWRSVARKQETIRLFVQAYREENTKQPKCMENNSTARDQAQLHPSNLVTAIDPLSYFAILKLFRIYF